MSKQQRSKRSRRYRRAALWAFASALWYTAHPSHVSGRRKRRK